MLFLSLIFVLAASAKKPAAISDSTVPATVNKTVLLQLVNNARKKGCNCGSTYYAPVPPLTWNEQLEKAAYDHSKDMFQKKYFNHTGSDGTGTGERIVNLGYHWRWYGENIAQGYATEKNVVAGWLGSPGHCANIMNKNFKEMGAAKAGDYWTQDFGGR